MGYALLLCACILPHVSCWLCCTTMIGACSPTDVRVISAVLAALSSTVQHRTRCLRFSRLGRKRTLHSSHLWPHAHPRRLRGSVLLLIKTRISSYAFVANLYLHCGLAFLPVLLAKGIDRINDYVDRYSCLCLLACGVYVWYAWKGTSGLQRGA